MDLERSANGALAGALAAAAWAAQQPVDKRVFGSRYDDVELLGRALVRGRRWYPAGLAFHLQNGALFGAVYAQARPFLPGPPAARGLLAALAENFGLWPLVRLTDRLHPARDRLPVLAGSRRALAQATWRHALFGVLLGIVEQRLNAARDADLPVPADTNGHGPLEAAAVSAPVPAQPPLRAAGQRRRA